MRSRERMSNTVTRGIRVEVESELIEEQSDPASGSWVFAYHIRITNEGSETAQLLSRVWIITDSDGNERRVEGPGVVGEQPILAPGESFDYTSFCPLPTPVGSMEGLYRMRTVEGLLFDALIAPFTLAVPGAVN